MRIVSLNVWHGYQTSQLRDFLQSEIDRTDVFCFQEAIGGGIEKIVAELFDKEQYQTATAHKHIAEDKQYDLLTIVRKPFEIENHWGVLDDEDADTGKAMATEIKLGNSSILTIVGVHGIPRPGHKLDTEGRLRQSNQIVQALSGTKTIVCGDFNLLPEATESIRTFTAAGYRDLVTEYNIPTTRNQLAWSQHPDNKQLYADFTFTSPDITVRDFSVPDNEASDHLPMVIDI